MTAENDRYTSLKEMDNISPLLTYRQPISWWKVAGIQRTR